MPTNNDDLVISISTDLTAIRRQLRELGQSVTQATGGASKSFVDFGKQIDAAMTPMQKQINSMVGLPVGPKLKEWKGALADVATETAVVTQGFKLNRIGMMELQASGINAFQALSSGMSAMRVAEMEGAQVLGALVQGTEGGFKGVGNVLKGFGLGLAGLVGGPIPAIALGLTAAGAAGALAFLEIDKSAISAKDAAVLFKDQLDEIKKSAPDVAKSVEAIFNSGESNNAILAGLKMSTSELKAGLQQSLQKLEESMARAGGGGSYTSYRQMLDLVDAAKTGAITVADLRDKLAQIYLDPSTSEGARKLAGTLLDGSKEARVFENELGGLNGAIGQIGDVASAQIKDVAALTNALSTLAGLEMPALSVSDKAQQAFIAGMKNAPDAITRQVVQNAYDAAQQRIEDAKGPYGDGVITIPTARPNIEMEGMPWLKKTHHRAPAIPHTANDSITESIAQLQGRTQELAVQRGLLGATYEEQTRVNTAYSLTSKALKDVREEARKKGVQDWQDVQLSDEQKAKIDAASEAYAQQAAALKQAREALQETADAARDFTSTFIDDMIDGKSATEALGDALKQLGKRFEDLALNSLFGGGSGGGTGLFGQIFGSLFGGGVGGGGADPWLGLRANGGPVTAGMPYIVGEKRPELFVPRTSGTIIPQVPTIQTGGSSSISTTMHVTVAVTGVGDKDLLAKTTQGATMAVNQALKHYDKGLPAKVADYVARPRKRV